VVHSRRSRLLAWSRCPYWLKVTLRSAALAGQLGLNRFGEQLQGLVSAMADRVSVVTDRLDGLTNMMSGATGKTVKNMA
jgi:hypothetical protein